MNAEWKISDLPQALREDALEYCKRAGKKLDHIWMANKQSISDMFYVHGLINYLGFKGYSVRDIAAATNCEPDKVRKTLETRGVKEVPIRTTDYERLA